VGGGAAQTPLSRDRGMLSHQLGLHRQRMMGWRQYLSLKEDTVSWLQAALAFCFYPYSEFCR
jgi:hypothetical protein